jgi:HPt (histidine-containing phosphotransfer) domain-containing protein
VQQEAHALKGSVGNFGSRSAFEMASRLEQAGRDHDWEQVGDAWHVLEVALNSLRLALADFCRVEASHQNT